MASNFSKLEGVLKEIKSENVDNTFFTVEQVDDTIKKSTHEIKDYTFLSADTIVGSLEKMTESLKESTIFMTDYLDDTFKGLIGKFDEQKSFVAPQPTQPTQTNEEVKPVTEEKILESVTTNKVNESNIEKIKENTSPEQQVENTNKSFVNTFGADFKELFTKTLKSIVDGLGNITKSMIRAGLGAVGKAVKSPFEALKNAAIETAALAASVLGITKFFDGMSKASQWFGENANFGEKIASGFANVIGSFLGFTEEETKNLAKNMSMVFQKIWNWLDATFTQIFKGAADLIMGLFSGDGSRVWQGVRTIFNAVVDGVGAIAQAVLALFVGDQWAGSIVGFVKKILKAIPDAVEFIWNGITSALSNIIDFVNNRIIKFLPRVKPISNPFADGAQTNQTTQAVTSNQPQVEVSEVVTQPQTNTASRVVVEESRNNAATRDQRTITPQINQSAPTQVVTQVNNNATSNATFGVGFGTQIGKGNSHWAVYTSIP